MENEIKKNKYIEIVKRLLIANEEGRIVAGKSAPFYDGTPVYLTLSQVERMAQKELHPKTLEEHIGFYKI